MALAWSLSFLLSKMGLPARFHELLLESQFRALFSGVASDGERHPQTLLFWFLRIPELSVLSTPCCLEGYCWPAQVEREGLVYLFIHSLIHSGLAVSWNSRCFLFFVSEMVLLCSSDCTSIHCGAQAASNL